MNKIKNRLKMVATGAALAAASSGAWGELPQAELLPRGTISWDTSWLSVGNGDFHIPLDACICTGTEVVYDPNRPILTALHLRAPSPSTSMESVQSELNRYVYNRNKIRGLFGPLKLPCGLSDEANRPRNFFVAAVFQYYPEGGGDILIRPDFALCPSAEAVPTSITLTRVQIGRIYKNGELISIDNVDDPIKSYMAPNHKDPVFVSRDITISNANFQAPDQSIKDSLCILKAGRYNPDTDAIAFSVYIQRGNSTDADSYGVLTCIFLTPNPHADKIKKTIQLGALKKLADDKYFSTLSAIYKTDLAATATFAANFNALAPTLGLSTISTDADQATCKDAWNAALNNAPLLTTLMNCLREGGPFGVEGFYWLLNEDLTGAMHYNNRTNPSGTANNIHNLLLDLHQL